MSLYSGLFYSNEVNELFSDKNTVGYMLKVEAALAQSQAKHGVISQEAAQVIVGCCNPEMIDIEKLKNEIKLGGNAAIPLVKALTKVVKNNSFEASKFVHLGATSQDIVDTATVLQIRDFVDWLDKKLEIFITELVRISEKYKNTVMVGRTLLQQARPITFGLKTALWLEGIERSFARIREMKERLFVIQLSGAVGSQNANITDEICLTFSSILKLKKANSWQSERDNFNELASKLGILVGTLGKIAKDVSLLMQTEVGEVFESAGEGKGGSSTMPHKRNPVTCAAILANATRTPHLVGSMLLSMGQEHERSAGLWHAEWEVLSEIMLLTGGSVEKSIDLISGLEVDEKRMLHNIEITKGLIFAENVSLALATKMGKIQAHEIVEKACKTAISKKKHLKEVLLENNIELENLDELFMPENSIGNSIEIVDAILLSQSRKDAEL
ncbi:3-carboxy-cis,cis-muconate cycloisomerase [Lacihabitans sp. LS3-19]|uniref:3-carboxy-cis,cis-muconate cycloisomerase n=1 Tax=Lacihabitans sp. LS3-19 TaxID=2487335 RepID=UPI0020CC23B9|nr:3-carboxy-cis,cis-muconate cycloisomerase [Lacihabitans sp. LS3-19]MCP9770527.1 3-carboxy-cis,cis-muconate cycloisomerase [Lacihabitans sp. LS3-19]